MKKESSADEVDKEVECIKSCEQNSVQILKQKTDPSKPKPIEHKEDKELEILLDHHQSHTFAQSSPLYRKRH